MKLLLSLTVTLLVTMWTVFDTAWFITPVDITYTRESNSFLLVRRVRVEMYADTWIEIQTRGELECSAYSNNLFQHAPGNSVRFEVKESLIDCLQTPGPKVYISKRKGYLVGLIPLRSSTFETIIE